MIAYHRERLRSAPISPYTLKSVMWQLLNGLSFLEQVLVAVYARSVTQPCSPSRMPSGRAPSGKHTA
jgi:hypothetical protein